MEHIVRTILQSQKLKDINAVVRGADRVISCYFTDFGRSAISPLISSKPRGAQYDDYEGYNKLNDPDFDHSKEFDFAENQPKYHKDIESTITKKEGSVASEHYNPNNSFKATPPAFKSLNGNSSRNFSSMARPPTDKVGVQADPYVVDPSINVLEKEPTIPNPHAQKSMDNVIDKSFNDYQTAVENEETEKIVSTRRRIVRKNLQERKVPSSSLARTASFAGLGLNLAASAVGGVVKNIFSSEKTSVADSILTEENAEKISKTFSRMRGIPLKLGQVLSMQEDNLVPKVISKALESAQKSADIMPQSQLYQMMSRELGIDWQEKFESFDIQPLAAASIGQVHKARTREQIDVAVKIQYPGVARSIDSDINNVKRLLLYPNILPRSLFMDDILKHIRAELLEECDYGIEAKKQIDFRALVQGYEGFYVPEIFPELSTKRVLTQEFVEGVNVDECVQVLNQDQKNKLGEKIFKILLVQLFEIGYMQTDPNPANFLYNAEKDVLNLIDFGAAQRFSDKFVDNYMDVIYGSAIKDNNLVYKGSKNVGIITGEESREMLDAHVESVMIIGEPFAMQEPFDFGNQNLTARIYEKIPVLLQHRLKPPPQVVYSLHRMLSGGYLLCMKLGSVVHVSKLFKETRAKFLAKKM